MDLRILTAASVLAAMGMLAGCGADEPGEPTTYEDTADRAPTPETATPGTREPTTQDPTTGQPMPGEDVAGRDERMTQPTMEPGRTTGETAGTAGQTTDEPMGMTEFAALDTNSDGMIDENEWQPEAADGMEFDEIDSDGSGDIDRQEFQEAVGSAGGGTTQPDEDALDPTTP